MTEVIVVVREVGRTKPEYSLRFSLPEIPRVGEYISVFRPHQSPHSEDLVVRKVWWHVHHGEARSHRPDDDEIVGRVRDIMVECDQAIGPYASEPWAAKLDAATERGVEIERFDVARRL